MENDRLINKAGWLKYSLLCLLSCPLSVTAAIDSKTAETPLAITNLTNRDVETQNNLLEIQQNSRKRTLTGTVVDEADGTPIVGANIIIKGSKTGVITDLDGRFSIPINEKGGTLEISYIGYKKQNVYITDQGFINVKLASDNEMLSEVVIVGAGTQKKVSVTGAITSVKGATLKAPSSSLTNSIAGKLAGVVSTTSSGEPGSTSSFYIRGISTFGGVSTPLILLDGVEISSGDLDRIPSESIESFSILKDASATAIYGARGANGVIIITTKSGQEGKVQVNFGASYGLRKVTKMVDVLNPYEFVMWQQELDQKSFNYGTFDDLEIYKSYTDTDYQGEIFGRTGNQQQYNISVSGGNKDTKFNISYSRNDEKSIMLNSGFAKDNINAKINTKINKWLTFDFNARLSYQKVKGTGSGADDNQSSATTSVNARSVVFAPVEKLISGGSDDDENVNNARYTPIEILNATYKRVSRFQQNYNAGVNWEPVKGLKFRSEFGYGWKYNNTDQVWGVEATNNSKYGNPGMPQALLTKLINKNWRNANTVTYNNDKMFNLNHRMNVMLGHEVSSSYDHKTTMTSVGFPKNMSIKEVLANMGQGQALPTDTYIGIKDNLLSFFGRINYTINDKYLMTFTMRADGSSKFASGNQWGYFPSLALAWRISDEAFMRNSQEWLSNLKLRLSIGTAGNNRIPSGSLETTYSLAGSGDKHIYFNNTSSVVLQRGKNLSNPNLKWETTLTRNIGLDFGFWNGRLSGSLDAYWNTTKDLLMQTTLPKGAGYEFQYQNFGQTSNKGIELALDAILVDQKDFGLNFNFNISYNQAKIDKLPTNKIWQSSGWGGSLIAGIDDFLIEEGGRLGEVYGYKLDGFYTTEDFTWDNGWKLKEGRVNPTESGMKVNNFGPGSPKLKANADGKIEKERLGNTIPKITGGFGINARYKSFDLSAFFNYSLGNKIINATKLASGFYSDTKKDWNLNNEFNLSKRYTWIDPANGMDMTSKSYINEFGSDYAINRLNEINAGASIFNPASITQIPLLDWAVEDGAFLRVNNISIGYTLPKVFVQKLQMQNVRIYFTGYNLYCFTKYSGADPEVDTCRKTPMTPGIDYSAYPKSRSFVGGINVTF